MAMAEVVKSVAVPPCALAAGSHGGLSFLAAGPAPGYAKPRAAEGYLLQVFPTGLDAERGTTFRSPAAFSSLDWASPTEATCWRSAYSSGLIAGGLENGSVAVWDPRHKLLDLYLAATPEIIEDYFTPKPSLPFNHVTTNLKESQYKLDYEEDEFEVKMHPGWAEFKLNESHFAADDLEELSLHHMPPPDALTDILTLLCSNSGPVRGLSFSPKEPNFLSSGCESVISVWDLTKPSIEEIPTCQFTAADENVQITHLAWSPVVSKLIASASNVGATLWDVSTDSPLIRKLPWKVRCSCVEWSPRNENLMAVGAYPCDSSAVKVWDLRNMERPMLEFCEGTGGVSGLSWSPYDNDTLVGCTNKKVVILNIKEGQVVHEVETCSSCFDVCFAKNMEDCFAVSCSNHIDLYHQVLEI